MADTYNVKSTVYISDGSSTLATLTVTDALTLTEGWTAYQDTFATGITDQSIPLGLSATKRVTVISSQPISIKLNLDTNTAIAVHDSVVILSDTNITALYLTNASGATATVKFLFGK